MPDLEGKDKADGDTDTPLHAQSEGREGDAKDDPALSGDQEGSPPYQQPEEGKADEPAKH